MVLQLALAVDYAIILCHRFMEEHEDKDAREAVIVHRRNLRHKTSVMRIVNGSGKSQKQPGHQEKGLANIEAMDGYILTQQLSPRAFAELIDMDVEVADLLYSAYAVEEEWCCPC